MPVKILSKYRYIIHTKGVFATKREALEYEREFLLKKAKDVNMGFSQFVEAYMEDMKPRLKLYIFLTKRHIMDTNIIPYFEKKSLAEITAIDIIRWQNQLSAIFNHACRFYGLGKMNYIMACAEEIVVREMVYV